MSFDKKGNATEQQIGKSCYVIGWCDAYGSSYRTVSFTFERRKALIECIRKRRYNFTHETHQFLPYSAPLYNDNTLCVLTKFQWDAVIDEVYKDMPRGQRLMPIDIITRAPKNGVLYEKEKYENRGVDKNV